MIPSVKQLLLEWDGEKMEQLGRSIDRLLARKSGKMKRTSLGNNNRDWFALRRTRLLIQCKTVCVQHGKESIRSHVLRRRHRKTKAQDREWRKAGERTSDPFFFFPARNRTCSACWSHHQTQLRYMYDAAQLYIYIDRWSHGLALPLHHHQLQFILAPSTRVVDERTIELTPRSSYRPRRRRSGARVHG